MKRLRRILTAALASTCLFACASTSTSVRPLAPRRPWNEPREQLDKSDIVYGMQQVRPAVRDCFARHGNEGIYSAALTIGNSGHVTAVHVRGPDAESNDCVGHAVATATFPPFSGVPISLIYPFVLR